MKKVPTTIVTGFLGSGKTTIIRHLIEQVQANNEQVVYIKNELGESDIDGQVIAGQHIQTRQLLNGCICCTLTGPFLHAIDELIETTKPDRIIIEASGTADPAALALMVSSHQALIRDGLLNIVDVIHFDSYPELTYSAKEQARFTDLIVFNKVEEVSIERKQQVVEYVRELNETAPIVEAPHGHLSIAIAFGSNHNQLASLLQDHPQDHNHLDHDQIDVIEIQLPPVNDQQTVTNILSKLPSNVIRVKGILEIQSDWFLVNAIAKRVSWEKLAEHEAYTPKLICLGFSLKPLQPDIQALFSEVRA